MRSRRHSVIAICLKQAALHTVQLLAAVLGMATWMARTLAAYFDVNGFFGGEGGPRFFFGLRPRLFGMDKREVWHSRQCVKPFRN